MSRESNLVNSQVDVNRAVFVMNARNNLHRKEYQDLDLSDEQIALHIESAITSLGEALLEYKRQQPMEF